MFEIQNIYCVVKRSELDYYHSSDKRSDRFMRLSQVKRERIKESNHNQKTFIEQFRRTSEKLGFEIEFITETEMDQITPQENDLVISCGGDGTFLSCAQRYQKAHFLGMNSDFSHIEGQGSHGALTSTNWTNLETNLKRLIAKDFFIDHWSRLQVKINGETLDRCAVNDIYFGQKIAYQTCDFTLTQSGIEEDFMCSGVICCTGMGSHAWYYNAGGSPFSNEIDAFGFKVLFPNLKSGLKYSSGIVSSRNELIICPQGDGYIISFDSKSDVIEMELGDEIRVFLAPDMAVRVISFHSD